MDIIVQKYGGSSLAEDGQLCAVARQVARTRESGKAVVVVVSARGKTTNRLLASAGKLNSNPEHRELDMLLASGEQASASMLSLTLHDLGHDAIALSCPQAGVITCDSHLNARIKKVDPERMLSKLSEGQIVVVAGFQGATPADDITTLGRGGSDTTAVAIAAAVGPRRCEIYSDVDGVYTADPRKVPDAQRLRTVSLAEMKTLAHHGAGVLNERAIDYAIEHQVTIVCRKAHGKGEETSVCAQPDLSDSRVVAWPATMSCCRLSTARVQTARGWTSACRSWICLFPSWPKANPDDFWCRWARSPTTAAWPRRCARSFPKMSGSAGRLPAFRRLATGPASRPGRLILPVGCCGMPVWTCTRACALSMP